MNSENIILFLALECKDNSKDYEINKLRDEINSIKTQQDKLED